MKKLSLLSTLLLFLAGLLPNLQTIANNTLHEQAHLLANGLHVSNTLSTNCDNTIPDIEWQNTIGGSGDESLSIIRPTADGGYILGGSSNSNISGDKTNNSKGGYDYWIVKLNAAGDIEFQRTIGGNDYDYLTDIQQTTDGGYILGGYSYSGVSGNKTEPSQGIHGYGDYWVVKLSAIGTIEWQNTIGGDKDDYLTTIQQTTDGGYILGGYSWSGIFGDKTEVCNGWDDYWVVKLSATGTIEWQNTISGDINDELTIISQTTDGGYILGGYSDSGIANDKTEASQGSYDYWVVKLSATGIIEWQNTIGGSSYDNLQSIQQTTDGGYILGGYSYSGISGDKTEACQGYNDYWVVKLSATGTIQWQNTIGGSGDDQLQSIQQTADGGYILGGYSSSNISGNKTTTNKGDNDYWIVIIDANGVILSQKNIGGNAGDILQSVQQTTDGGYILGGYSGSSISGDKTETRQGENDYWVVKLPPLNLNALSANFTVSNNQCTNTAVAFINTSLFANTYNWYVNDTLVAITTNLNHTFNTSGAKNITLIAFDGNCSDTVTQIINITPPANISVTHTENGLTTSITASTGANSYSWDFDDGNLGTGISTQHTYALAGTYNVCLTINSSCGDSHICQNITVNTLSNCFATFGNIEWQNTIGGSQIEHLSTIQQTTDGGYVLGGYSKSGISGDKTEVNQGEYDYWVVKLSATGTIEWQTTIGGSNDDYLTAIQQTTDGGYIVGGYSESGISGNKTEANQSYSPYYDYWVIKLTAIGIIEWQNTIGGDKDDYLTAIQQTTDGGYIVGGYSNSGISGDKTEANQNGVPPSIDSTNDYWVVKLSATGIIEWQNTIGGDRTDYLQSIQQTTDGGYILGGYSNSGISGDKTETNQGSFSYHDYWVIKLTTAGAIEWQNTIGGSNDDYLTAIQQTTDGGYIVGGYSKSGISGDKTKASQGGFDYWILKLSNTGTIEWQNSIGGSSDDYLSSISQTTNGEYLMSGTSISGISGDKIEASQSSDYWVVKLDTYGNLMFQNTIGGTNQDFSPTIAQTSDGGYILGGTSNSNISGDKTENCQGLYDYWIVKLDTSEVPYASFQTPPNVCINTTATFINYSSNSTNYQWQIDGVVVDSTANLNYIFTTGGVHTITLVVDNGVCSSSKSQSVNVITSPNPNFAHSQNALTVNCIAQAGANGYTWNFGDGNTAIGQNTSHTYTTAGTYTVCLAAEYTCEIKSKCYNITVNATPNCNLFPTIEWQKITGGTNHDYLNTIVQTTDGGYMVGGRSSSGISGDKTEINQGDWGTYDYWILKLSATGIIQWQNTIGGSGNDYLQSLQQTTDGGYILGGYSWSGISGDKTEASQGNYDYWVVKLNATGTIEWQNTIGGNGDDQLQSIQQTTDGGYIVGGYSNSGISGDKTGTNKGGYDYWVVKLNNNGSIVSQKTIGGDNDDYLVTVKQTTDGNYLLGGYSNSDISGDKTETSQDEYNDYWVIKLSPEGIILWQNTIGGNSGDMLQCLQQTIDGGYILGGRSNSGISGDKTEPSQGGSDYWIVKLTNSGTIEWQNTIGGNGGDILQDLQQTIDGGYILGGYSSSGISGDKTETSQGPYYTTDYWVVKLSNVGFIEWQRTIGQYADERLVSIQQTADGGYILGGTYGFEDILDDYDYYVVKLPSFTPPTAFFTTSIITTDTYTPITITNNSTNATSYQWQIDGVAVDTTTNLTYTFTTIGAHIITLVASNGECSTSYSKTITVTESMVMLQAKALLQCAITDLNVGNALMTTEFNSTLPTQQPFNAAPWNYTGTESVTIPANAVDWLLVELRNSANINQVIARKAVLLLNDGNLQDVGTPLQNSRVAFSGLASNQSYFVVLRHRSHQTITSTAAVPVSNNLMSIDFTQSADQTNGGAASLAYINGWYALKLVLTPTLSGNTAVCSGTTQTYTNSTPVSGVTYTWSATGGSILSGQGGNSVQIQWADGTSGTVTLTAEERLCSEVASASITVSLTPDAIITVGGTAAGGGTPGLTSYNLCPTCKVYLKSNYTNLTNYTLKWYKNNNELTQYQNYLGGYVKKAGNYKLKVIRNSTGCEDFSQIVSVTGGAPMLADNINPNINNTPSMGKDEELLFESENLELFVYPNPAQNRVTIAYNIADNSQLSLKIYDIMGQLQHTQTLAISNNTLDVDVSTYPSGTYLVQLLGDKGSVVSYLTVVK